MFGIFNHPLLTIRQVCRRLIEQLEQFTLLLDTALEEISVTLSNAESKVPLHSGEFITLFSNEVMNLFRTIACGKLSQYGEKNCQRCDALLSIHHISPRRPIGLYDDYASQKVWRSLLH